MNGLTLSRDPSSLYRRDDAVQAGAGVAGATGRVTALIDERIDPLPILRSTSAEGSAMIKDVTAGLHAKGLCPIYREKYYDE